LGAHDSREYSGEGKGGIQKILPGSELVPNVIPVLYKSVEVLEEPPESCTNRKKEQQKAKMIMPKAVSFSMVTETVYGEYVADPKGGESVRLEC
jgi:hypothetical protein